MPRRGKSKGKTDELSEVLPKVPKTRRATPKPGRVVPPSLTPYPPPNPVEDLVKLADSLPPEKRAPKEFTSRYLSSEELAELKTQQKSVGLTAAEKIVILEMAIADLGPTIIASRIGRSVQTVSKFLSQYRSTSVLGRAYLESKAEKLARRIVKSATVEESMEVLDRLDVLNKKREDRSAGNNQQFNIIVGGGAGSMREIPIPSQAQIEAAKGPEQ